jgi:hypothetical protein
METVFVKTFGIGPAVIRAKGEYMSLQKKVTDFYLKLNNYPTLRFISQDTGVQLTRAFRLLNGACMKVSEYEIFESRIRDKMSVEGLTDLVLRDSWKDLSFEELREVENLLRKKIKIRKLKGEGQC